MKGKPTVRKNMSSAVFSLRASYRNICRCMARCLLSSAKRTGKARLPAPEFVPLRRRLPYIFSGMAAGMLIVLGIAGLNRHFSTSTGNYVIIDGKCYTDTRLVREQAMVAFRDVSISEEEVFATLFSE